MSSELNSWTTSSVMGQQYLRTKEFLVCSKLPESSSKLGHHRPCNIVKTVLSVTIEASINGFKIVIINYYAMTC